MMRWKGPRYLNTEFHLFFCAFAVNLVLLCVFSLYSTWACVMLNSAQVSRNHRKDGQKGFGPILTCEIQSMSPTFPYAQKKEEGKNRRKKSKNKPFLSRTTREQGRDETDLLLHTEFGKRLYVSTKHRYSSPSSAVGTLEGPTCVFTRRLTLFNPLGYRQSTTQKPSSPCRLHTDHP